MTVMNVVHMRVKPGCEAEFVKIHEAFGAKALPGARNFWVVASGGRSYVIIGEWNTQAALVAARPAMIANLDKLRPILEDLGGGRGVTEPWVGEVVVHMKG